MTSKRARFVTYGEQVDLVRNAPRAAALGMRTVPGTWQSHPVVRSQRAGYHPLARLGPTQPCDGLNDVLHHEPDI